MQNTDGAGAVSNPSLLPRPEAEADDRRDVGSFPIPAEHTPALTGPPPVQTQSPLQTPPGGLGQQLQGGEGGPGEPAAAESQGSLALQGPMEGVFGHHQQISLPHGASPLGQEVVLLRLLFAAPAAAAVLLGWWASVCSAMDPPPRDLGAPRALILKIAAGACGALAALLLLATPIKAFWQQHHPWQRVCGQCRRCWEHLSGARAAGALPLAAAIVMAYGQLWQTPGGSLIKVDTVQAREGAQLSPLDPTGWYSQVASVPRGMRNRSLLDQGWPQVLLCTFLLYSRGPLEWFLFAELDQRLRDSLQGLDCLDVRVAQQGATLRRCLYAALLPLDVSEAELGQLHRMSIANKISVLVHRPCPDDAAQRSAEAFRVWRAGVLTAVQSGALRWCIYHNNNFKFIESELRALLLRVDELPPRRLRQGLLQPAGSAAV